MITLSLAYHMPLWLAITIYVPTQLPCGLWQVIWYSLVGLEKIFCLACLIWTYNRIGKAPASHKSSKPPQVMLDFADAGLHGVAKLCHGHQKRFVQLQQQILPNSSMSNSNYIRS